MNYTDADFAAYLKERKITAVRCGADRQDWREAEALAWQYRTGNLVVPEPTARELERHVADARRDVTALWLRAKHSISDAKMWWGLMPGHAFPDRCRENRQECRDYARKCLRDRERVKERLAYLTARMASMMEDA